MQPAALLALLIKKIGQLRELKAGRRGGGTQKMAELPNFSQSIAKFDTPAV